MPPRRIVTTLLWTACFAAVSGAAASTSQLWGAAGEAWNAQGRLSDFSYAGYHRGEQPIPNVPEATNVTDFGAVGDGVTDDTRAINAAIAATPKGAIYVPPGRYRITDYIFITKPGIVLRGAGPDKTVFWFPKGLDEVHPREMHESRGLPTSGYSFDGAFVALQGNYRAKAIAQIVANAPRGSHAVVVDTAASLAVGQAVLVVAHEDAAQSLKTYLYSGDPGDIRNGKPFETKLLVRISGIHGRRVEFDRPLRFETRAAWKPELCRFDPTVSESGVEAIGFEFPDVPYRGHFKEKGANALELRNVYNCWVRNVRIHNADMGVTIVACQNTVDGVVVTADANRGIRESGVPDCTGHHVFQCKHAEDNLVTHFDIQTCYVHDLSVEHAAGNVYADGRGRDLALDHHKDTPYENLYTAIDCGRGTRVWLSGGGASLGRECAGWGTFWNLRAATPIHPPPAGWGPRSMNFVGIATNAPAAVESGRWWEPGSDIQPPDLHQSQLARRLAAR